jgi:hypothetical protein
VPAYGDLAAQHRILMSEHEQLGILRGVAAQQHVVVAESAVSPSTT